jgi:RNA recognition motif-containing protein
MNTRIYFDNLSAAVTEKELMDLFSAYGNVVNVHVAGNRAGFVTMITPEGARAAMQSLSGKMLNSGILTLNEAPPNEELVNPANRRTSPRRKVSYLY